MKNERTDTWSKQQQQILATLRDRLSINNISKQINLIANMTPHLQFKLTDLMKIDLLKNHKKQKVITYIRNIPFLQILKIPNRNKDEDYVRIQYENSERRLIVTGIHKKRIEQMLAQYNQSPKRYIQTAKIAPKIISNTANWVTIETINDQSAKHLQKFMRTKKKAYDADNPINFKIQKKRIRIIIIKEDLFALLIDAMTESKAQQFYKNFQNNSQPIMQKKETEQNYMSLSQNKIKSTLIYRPMMMNDYQKQETKDQQLSDGFSQSNSLNSEIKDLAKANDVIQTSDQGIQAQNNAQSSQYSDEIQLNTTPRNRSPQVSPSSQSKRSKLIQETQNCKSEAIRQQQDQDISLIQQFSSPLRELKSETKNTKQQPSPNKIKQYSQLKAQNQEPLNQQLLKQNYLPQNSFPAISTQLQSKSLQTQSQTNKSLYSNIPYAKMKRYFNQFKSVNHKMLIELPKWMVSESQQQRYRHKFYGSLCKPKIKNLRQCQ